MSDTVSVVIRTMPGRERFLDKCLFILAGQTYPCIEVIIVAQRLSEDDSTDEIEKIGSRWTSSFSGLKCISHVAHTDARARSLNLGKNNSTGRYLAFLDDDDKIYPGHYEKLIEALKKSDYAWAYTDVVRALYNEHGQLVERTTPFCRSVYSFLDHLRGNFIPIHSFAIDRIRASNVGDVDESMSRNEDYEFILRLAFRHEPLYVRGFSAEYCIRNDGSNTVSDGTGHARHAWMKRRLWNAAQDFLDAKKIANFGWWIRELDELPMIHTLHQTIDRDASGSYYGGDVYRRMLQEYYSSTSWRITSGLRALARLSRGLPPQQFVIPPTEEAARLQVEEILRSTSWEITAPLRVLGRALRSRRPVQ